MIHSFKIIFANWWNQDCRRGAREQSSFWKPGRVSTQTKGIDSSTSRLVSVLLTDETIEETLVEWSKREAVYDGVIEYPDGLTLMVENKLSHGNVWQEQLSPARSSFSGNVDDVLLHDVAICLEWSEIFEGVLRYYDSGIAAFSSREISRDLLSFVEEFHPGLTPYRTFRLCGNRPQALDRRTIRLLDALAGRVGLESRDDEYLFRPERIAERIAIWFEPEATLKVGLWPADTVSQARRFYKGADRATFLGVDGWEVEPNLHFSYMNTHLIWAETNCAPDRYFDYFADGQLYGQMDEARLIPLAQRWANEGFVTREDQSKIKNQFTSTKRKTLNVIPGFSLSREWNLNTVIGLEDRENSMHILLMRSRLLSTAGEKHYKEMDRVSVHCFMLNKLVPLRKSWQFSLPRGMLEDHCVGNYLLSNIGSHFILYAVQGVLHYAPPDCAIPCELRGKPCPLLVNSLPLLHELLGKASFEYGKKDCVSIQQTPPNVAFPNSESVNCQI